MTATPHTTTYTIQAGSIAEWGTDTDPGFAYWRPRKLTPSYQDDDSNDAIVSDTLRQLDHLRITQPGRDWHAGFTITTPSADGLGYASIDFITSDELDAYGLGLMEVAHGRAA